MFVGRCVDHPKAKEIAAWVQANMSGICTVLDGQGKGDDCPSSALKPKPAPAMPQQPKEDDAHAAGEQDSGEFAEPDDEDKADDTAEDKAAATRVQPGRSRFKPVRLDSSPKLPKKKPKKAVDVDEEEVKSEVGVGRGQKRGPRGSDGQPMKYKKRVDAGTAGTAGAAGKQRRTTVKLEGEPRTLASHVLFLWIVFRRAVTVCQLLVELPISL